MSHDPAATNRSLRILIPLDRSPLASMTLSYAAHLPATEIAILHVMPDIGAVAAGIDPGGDIQPEDEIRKEFEEMAAPLRDAGRPVHVQLATGDPGEQVIAASDGFDLVMMATHGRSAAARAIFGSVSDHVTRHGTVPTLVLHGASHHDPLPAPTRLLVTLDGSPLSERTLPLATRLAAVTGLPLHLVRVVELQHVKETIHDMRVAEHSRLDIDFDEARQRTLTAAHDYLAKVTDRLQGEGVNATTEVPEGTVTFALLDTIQPTDITLLTSHGRHGFQRWLMGSVADKLMRDSPGPILLVPTRDGTED
jgi:nucleotide-binding universal stress UspA family protein